ncbi:MAG TPA: O-antigen ligase family protein [Bryobacteraceae bacterium]|jgi:O-antigen ligase|nr:O-antigen ligase family protein [Bryobacteraceae bacterium]
MLRALGVRKWRASEFGALLAGIWATAAAVSPNIIYRVTLLGVPCILVFAYWLILRPSRWIPVFFVAVLLLPPLPVAWGDSGVHVAPLVAGLGLLAGVIRSGEWSAWSHPFTKAYGLFLCVLLASVGLAAVYSGWQIALGSLARVILFAIGGFVFLYGFAGPVGDGWEGDRMVRLLYRTAVAAAAFACFDFYFQLAAPGRFSEQFIYMENGPLRRAQGLFYEASTLGNFCAFFLVMVAVRFMRSEDRAVASRKGLVLGGIVLGGAIMLSYSRASVLNLVVALGVLVALHVEKIRRSSRVIAAGMAAAVMGALTVRATLPALSANYWGRLIGSFTFFSDSPDRILSGRVGHWEALLGFLAREPWHAFLGIGYKTLPYSTFAGSTVIADNTFLSLLIETGVAGLVVFAAMNVAILRTGWRAIRSGNAQAAFLGEWIFCFWCGQIAQMFSGDLITYWRVWPVYLWVLAAAGRHTKDRV